MIPLYAESWDEEVGARVKDTRGGGGGGSGCSRAGYVSLTYEEENERRETRAMYAAVSDLWLLSSLPSANIACQCTWYSQMSRNA